MKTWLIEPRDPLIVRDGRPFSADIAGARAASLPFPFPSTIAGAVRTRHGREKGGDFDDSLIREVRSKRVHGPLLVELNGDGTVADWLLPAPADAFWGECESNRRDIANLTRLLPLAMAEGELTNLASELAPVRAPHPLTGKPSGSAPRYWRWKNFQDWLIHPKDHIEVELEKWGHEGPATETRVHVGIQPSKPNRASSLTAIDGALYQTRGLEFTDIPKGNGLSSARRLALAIATDADGLKAGLAPLGGERRLASWSVSKTPKVDLFSENGLDLLKERIAKKIAETRACRLILLTPAHFVDGFLPTWLTQATPALGVTVRAVAIQRPQVVSGWDFDRRHGARCEGRPKPTRRLAPAGSVYFLELGSSDDNAVKLWIEQVWMRCVSDDDADGDPAQSRRDGFGLAILGASEKVEVKK
jgi:CRISPR-associated protein Cmr3